MRIEIEVRQRIGISQGSFERRSTQRNQGGPKIRETIIAAPTADKVGRTPNAVIVYFVVAIGEVRCKRLNFWGWHLSQPVFEQFTLLPHVGRR